MRRVVRDALRAALRNSRAVRLVGAASLPTATDAITTGTRSTHYDYALDYDYDSHVLPPRRSARVDDDAQYEAGLRPRTLDDYIGQDRVRENLQVSIAAARAARRGARSRPAVRPARPRQDDAGVRDRQRARRAGPRDVGPGAREARRPGGDPDQPAGARGALHRRDPPDVAGDRGDPLSRRWRTTSSTS